MSQVGTIDVSEIRNSSDILLGVPADLSFFGPYVQRSIEEVLQVGGEAYHAKGPEGSTLGVFIYDDFEKTGTVYTRSKEVFDYFYELKPFSFLWSELRTEHESETYDIYSIDFDKPTINHPFSHAISIAEEKDMRQIERFMVLSHPGINPRWPRVALQNGDKCFLVKFEEEIAGIGWLSLVNGIGRLYSLHVRPQFRRIGLGQDILFARLLWLKAKHARSAFSEISRDNLASKRTSMKGRMNVAGQVYQYLGKDHGPPRPPEEATKF